MSTVVVKCNLRSTTEEDFIDFTNVINRQFLMSFKKLPGRNTKSHPVKIIIDPGEYILTGTVCMGATIIGARRMGTKENKKVCYYVNESIHQSLGVIQVIPNFNLSTTVLCYTSKIKSSKGGVEATVYGYTESTDDIISTGGVLPSDMANGDVICISGLGPYSGAFGRKFLINPAVMYYFCTKDDVGKLQELMPDLKLSGEEDVFQL
eukprot:sb/3470400/